MKRMNILRFLITCVLCVALIGTAVIGNPAEAASAQDVSAAALPYLAETESQEKVAVSFNAEMLFEDEVLEVTFQTETTLSTTTTTLEGLP